MSVKSSSILAAGLVIATILVGLSWHLPRQVAAQPAGPAPSQVGRFQMTGIPNHVYLLDTVTGQVWDGQSNTGSVDENFKKPKVKAQQ